MSEIGGLPYRRAQLQELADLAMSRSRLAHDVVHLKPDLIFAMTSVRHFKAATTTIPIVDILARFGLVAELTKPGFNRSWVSHDDDGRALLARDGIEVAPMAGLDRDSGAPAADAAA